MKISARQKASRAIKLGRIVRPDACSDCGKVCKPEGHHPDYSKPLSLIFLCKRCHIDLHIKQNDFIPTDEALTNRNKAWAERHEMFLARKAAENKVEALHQMLQQGAGK